MFRARLATRRPRPAKDTAPSRQTPATSASEPRTARRRRNGRTAGAPPRRRERAGAEQRASRYSRRRIGVATSRLRSLRLRAWTIAKPTPHSPPLMRFMPSSPGQQQVDVARPAPSTRLARREYVRAAGGALQQRRPRRAAPAGFPRASGRGDRRGRARLDDDLHLGALRARAISRARAGAHRDARRPLQRVARSAAPARVDDADDHRLGPRAGRPARARTPAGSGSRRPRTALRARGGTRAGARASAPRAVDTRRRGHASRRCLPVSATNTSSSVACAW